jgi:hypothetical protein
VRALPAKEKFHAKPHGVEFFALTHTPATAYGGKKKFHAMVCAYKG